MQTHLCWQAANQWLPGGEEATPGVSQMYIHTSKLTKLDIVNRLFIFCQLYLNKAVSKICNSSIPRFLPQLCTTGQLSSHNPAMRLGLLLRRGFQRVCGLEESRRSWRQENYNRKGKVHILNAQTQGLPAPLGSQNPSVTPPVLLLQCFQCYSSLQE